MRKVFVLLVMVAGFLNLIHSTQGQRSTSTSPTGSETSSKTVGYVLGKVISVASQEKRIQLRLDSGEEYWVRFEEPTQFLRVQPGKTTLEGAETTTPDKIGIGDRLMARGEIVAESRSISAQQIIVMSKGEIAEKRERDQREWSERGISGTITTLDPQKREVVVMATTPQQGSEQVIVTLGGNVTYRRYTPISPEFSDAKSSSFDELQMGDQLWVQGERSADGAQIQAEVIVSGSFAMTGGTISAIDPAGEITIDNLPTQAPLTISLHPKSKLRRLPPEMAARLAALGPPSAGQGEGGNRQEGSEASGRDPEGRQGGPPDRTEYIQRLLEGLPSITLGDLKPGDAVLVSSVTGEDPGRVTAIMVVAGVEALLRAPASPGSPVSGLSLGLTSEAFSFSIRPPN